MGRCSGGWCATVIDWCIYGVTFGWGVGLVFEWGDARLMYCTDVVVDFGGILLCLINGGVIDCLSGGSASLLLLNDVDNVTLLLFN